MGTVIKCGEDDDPIGVCTVFNLKQHSHLKSLAELKSFLLARCSNDSCKEALKKVRLHVMRIGGALSPTD